MRPEIYYFTGTGNSYVIAKNLAAGLDADPVFITDAMSRSPLFVNSDIIGLVFPVYMWGIPLIVARFISQIRNLKGRYVFGVADCGGEPSGALNILRNTVRKVGGELAGGFKIIMPNNYIPFGGADTEEEQAADFKNMKDRIKEISGYVQSRKKGVIETAGFFSRLLYSGLIYHAARGMINKMDKNFLADDTCNSCGICSKICPVDNIKMTGGKPSWKGKCEQCFACLQWCPAEALQYGKSSIGRKRYHHPETSLKFMLEKSN